MELLYIFRPLVVVLFVALKGPSLLVLLEFCYLENPVRFSGSFVHVEFALPLKYGPLRG